MQQKPKHPKVIYQPRGSRYPIIQDLGPKSHNNRKSLLVRYLDHLGRFLQYCPEKVQVPIDEGLWVSRRELL